MDFNEFDDLEEQDGRGSTTPDDLEPEESHDDEEPEAPEAPQFVELTNEEYDALPLQDRRRYVTKLESWRKAKKREAARNRKRVQIARAKAGIPAGIEKRLALEWKTNLQDLKSNVERAHELRELTTRLVDFNYVRREAEAVIDRIRQGIHAEANGPGRFYEVIAADYLEHAKRYGVSEYNPPFLVVMRLEAEHHARRNAALKALQEDPSYRYRLAYGLDVDFVSNLEYYGEFWPTVFHWYLTNRQDPSYGYNWDLADELVANFEIPAKYLNSPFAGSKSIWTRLDNYRRGIAPTPYKVKSIGQILAEDDIVLKALKDRGY